MSSRTAYRAGASDSEDDLATAAANGTRKTTKTKPSMPKASAAAKPATKRKAAAPKPSSRPALKDRTNIPSDGEEDAVDDDDYAAKPKAKRAKTTTTAARKPRAKKPATKETLGVIPETQPDPIEEDVEQSIEITQDEVLDITKAPTPQQVPRFVQRPRSTSVQPLPPRPSARSVSAQAGHVPAHRERSGSASATERERTRGGDPETRRKLNDLTRKHEALNLKYQNLQDIGKTQAEEKFEALKRASDEKAEDANKLISQLKREIANLKKSAGDKDELASLQKKINDLTATSEKSTADAAAETSSLKEKLQTKENEVKSLEAKLVAARQQISNGSTTAQDGKSQASQTKSVAAAATTASEKEKEAKMKENLYSDITGLIIRGVKRKDGEDEFDCIQTGRNGTLHFHLSIANPTSASQPNPRTPSGISYEDAEFAYEPFLDEERDKGLVEILPDYLAEDICFPRSHAVKFYNALLDAMTKRVVVEED